MLLRYAVFFEQLAGKETFAAEASNSDDDDQIHFDHALEEEGILK